MGTQCFKEVMKLVEESDRDGLLWKARDTSGFSGEKTIGALQRLARRQHDAGEGVYLEIGVFQGLTLISVAGALKDATAFGIDNFSQFDPESKNKDLVHQRAASNNIENIRLINMDYEDALENLGDHIGDSKIGLYFVDGPHDYRSQSVCLNLARRHLSDRCVIVVDDCNYEHVRLANRDFLMANPEFKLIFEAYTECHPSNMTGAVEEKARAGWWDGVNIIVRDPDNELSPMFPETVRDRRLHENDHIVHCLKYGMLAPDAVSLLQRLLSFRPMAAFHYFMAIRSGLRNTDKTRVGKYAEMNTYSEELPEERYNESLR